jgi:hypothetical protein
MSDPGATTAARAAPQRLTRPAPISGARDVAVALLSFAAGLPALFFALSSRADLSAILGLHMAALLVSIVFLALRLRAGGELTIPVLLLITGFVCGPLGGLGTACTALALMRRPRAAVRLQSWYEYIAGIVARDRTARLYEELVSNRLHSDPTADVPRFRPILHGTSVEEQQRVLGVIGRRYHSDFRAVLRDALRNKNGFIRAQAAAVASRLDMEEKKSLWAGASPRNAGEAGARQPDALP